MARTSRLSSMEADRQKADFIGTISHELRSPLHDILASAEFLNSAETVEDTFQECLIGTISTCGRTLLGTVNHILDYSKIASFERNTKGKAPARTKTGLVGSKTSINKYITAGLSLFAVIDVALVEDVIEGVTAGQILQTISSTDVASFSTSSQAKTHERGIKIKPEAGIKALTKDMLQRWAQIGTLFINKLRNTEKQRGLSARDCTPQSDHFKEALDYCTQDKCGHVLFLDKCLTVQSSTRRAKIHLKQHAHAHAAV